MRRIVYGLTLLALTGCVSTAETIVEAPFHLAHAGYRAIVPSQAELDRRRGKAERKHEEADAKAAKKAEKERRKSARDVARQSG